MIVSIVRGNFYGCHSSHSISVYFVDKFNSKCSENFPHFLNSFIEKGKGWKDRWISNKIEKNEVLKLSVIIAIRLGKTANRNSRFSALSNGQWKPLWKKKKKHFTRKGSYNAVLHSVDIKTCFYPITVSVSFSRIFTCLQSYFSH